MLPPDGNLYHFSVKKMAAFLYETRVDQSGIQLCICDKVDGKKFSHMSEADLHQYGILNAITLYFRSKSYKRRPNFMLWSCDLSCFWSRWSTSSFVIEVTTN